MKKPISHFLFPALAAAFLCSGCAHVDLAPHVAGRIIDQSTKGPVPNATIYFDQYPEQVVLSADGGNFDSPEIRHLVIFPKDLSHLTTTLSLTVKAENYQSAGKTFFWTGKIAPGQTNEVIYLQPK